MKTALVLSAGGMFAAWEAGVWKTLSSKFQPDMVVGASAGAWNGWAIAGGCAPEELIREWLDPRTAELMRLRVPWIPWRGVFDSEPLDHQARELFLRFQPRVPFGMTLTELDFGRMRAHLVRESEMTWRHLAAACSVPFGHRPVRISGKWFVDGGFLGALPVWAALEMGATRVVTVNALPKLPSRVLRAAVRMLTIVAERPRAVEPFDVIHVQPSAELGTLGDAVRWAPKNIARWIESGERDVNRALASITM
jgi:predicted acylesterase/phospholipase RssA